MTDYPVEVVNVSNIPEHLRIGRSTGIWKWLRVHIVDVMGKEAKIKGSVTHRLHLPNKRAMLCAQSAANSTKPTKARKGRKKITICFNDPAFEIITRSEPSSSSRDGAYYLYIQVNYSFLRKGGTNE